MASVTSTTVVSQETLPDGRLRVRYRFDLLDNRNDNHVEYVGPRFVPAGTDLDADMTSLAPTVLAHLANREREQYVSDIEGGADPLHYDAGGYFVKETPRWNTWEQAFIAVARYYWSRTDQLELVPYATSWGRVSKQDKTGMLGITNQTETDMNGDMQTAITTRASLDAYSPYFEAE